MEYFMRFPGGKTKALTLSYDDGNLADLKLMEILKRYNIKATFNLNSGMMQREFNNRFTKEEATNSYDTTFFEIASHGIHHANIENISGSELVKEYYEDKKNLEQMFSQPVLGGAYPYGNYNGELLELLKIMGMKYFRTTRSTYSFALPKNPLLLDPTIRHKDLRLNELVDAFVKAQPDHNPYLFYLWGHSFEFDFDNNWEVIETFAQKVSNKEEIWYATNIEIVKYIEAFNRLEVTIGFDSIYNPSGIDVWITTRGKVYCVKPNQRIFIDKEKSYF